MRSLLVLLAACAWSLLLLSTAAAERAATPAHAVVKTAYNKTLKKTILVDSAGFTLYMYASDYRGKSYCYDDPEYHCSKGWPPLLTKGAPKAGAGAQAALLGTTKRQGGALQVTYKGHPLYRDAGAPDFGLHKDAKPGDVNGQLFSGIWWVLSPNGSKITVVP
jgi:predicted lipoprotein with Yx(FWY)xxD motif